MEINKHAYLIIAHNNFNQLEQLIKLLDYSKNDIYLHVDKKATSFCYDSIETKYSDLIFIERINANWGGYSLIECEMNLMKAAAPKHYQYYHLISGSDLPLKKQEEIHHFFNVNKGKNYIHFAEKENRTKSFISRTRYYHFFRDIIGRNRGFKFLVLKCFEKSMMLIQKMLKVHRKEYIPLYMGSQWFSITDSLLQYVLSQEKIIKKQFKYSFCGDEIFLQSIAMTSSFRESIVNNSLRAIDWKRGNPYVYRKEDVQNLISSPYLFARKFDQKIDQSAIDAVVEYIKYNTV